MELERQFNRIIGQIESEIRRTQKELHDLSSRVGYMEAKRQMREQIDANKELIAHIMGQAQAYTRGVIFGGYAAFFAAWAFAKSVVEPIYAVGSVALILLSVIVFMTFEVWKMYRSNVDFAKYARALREDMENVLEVQRDFNEDQSKKVIRLQPIWTGTVIWCLVTGVGAVMVLGAGFAVYIWNAFALPLSGAPA